MRRIQFFVATACAAATLVSPLSAADLKLDAQQSASSATPMPAVDAPSIGYVITPRTMELRAILGVPGAARFSAPLPLPEGVKSAEVAPGQAWVLLMGASGAAAYQPFTQALQTISGGVASAWAFSPSGSRLALWNRALGQMSIVSGLPANPQVDQTLKIPQPDAFVLSDSGSLVYVSGGQLYTGSGQSLYQSSQPGVMAFEATREALVLFDRATGSLVELNLANPAPRTIAAGFGTPDQLYASSGQIYAGSNSAGSVWTFDYSNGLIGTQAVSVSRMTPCSIAGTMLVSYLPAGPAWLVNAQGVSFVPSANAPVTQ